MAQMAAGRRLPEPDKTPWTRGVPSSPTRGTAMSLKNSRSRERSRDRAFHSLILDYDSDRSIGLDEDGHHLRGGVASRLELRLECRVRFRRCLKFGDL